MSKDYSQLWGLAQSIQLLEGKLVQEGVQVVDEVEDLLLLAREAVILFLNKLLHFLRKYEAANIKS